MAVEIDISWAGRPASDFARMYRVAANIKTFKPVLEEIGREVVAPSVALNFTSGGRPSWTPLAEATKRTKIARGQGTRILVASTALEKAASRWSRYLVDANKLEAFPRGIPYWEYHQTGTPKMPQRVIMMLQAQDRTAINRKFANYFRKFLTFDPRKAGARQFLGT